MSKPTLDRLPKIECNDEKVARSPGKPLLALMQMRDQRTVRTEELIGPMGITSQQDVELLRRSCPERRGGSACAKCCHPARPQLGQRRSQLRESPDLFSKLLRQFQALVDRG
jgi:hypothetical protein